MKSKVRTVEMRPQYSRRVVTSGIKMTNYHIIA